MPDSSISNGFRNISLNAISKRGAKTGSSDDFLAKYMTECEDNPFHIGKNPKVSIE